MKEEILILTAYTKTIPWNNYGKNDYAETSIRINKAYAERYGYAFKAIEYGDVIDDLFPTWIKIDAIIKELYEGWEYVCWIDADAIFVTSKSLDFMKGKNIALTKSLPWNGRVLTTTSTGFMLIKNTERSKHIFTSLWNGVNVWQEGKYALGNWHEQGMLDAAYVEPQLLETGLLEKNTVRLMQKQYEDISGVVNTEDFRIFPSAYQSSDIHHIKFIFHAAGDTPTKNKRLLQLESSTVQKMNTENKINITFKEGPKVEITGAENHTYEVRFYDKEKEIWKNEIQNNMWTACSIKWYVPWLIIIKNKTTGITQEEILNLEGKKVYIRFESAALGDTIAWIPYVEEFRKKHKCVVICATFFNFLFEKGYSQIKFISPTEPYTEYYAKYEIGWFDDPNKNPTNVKTIPLQQTATDVLGLTYVEIKPIIHL